MEGLKDIARRREYGYALAIASITVAIRYFGDFSKMAHRIAIRSTAATAAISALLVYLTDKNLGFICIIGGIFVATVWLWAALKIEAILARQCGDIVCS